MTVRIKKRNGTESLIARIEEISGVDLGVCYQCGKCTSGCPVSGLAESPPAEIIRRLHLGAGEELLESDIVWMCASCEICSARCPMGIDFAAVMDALRILSNELGTAKPKGNVPLFNRAFLQTVRFFGRTYDLAMIAAYKIGTLGFLQDMDKFPAMLKKRKIAIMPPRGSDSHTVKRIFDKVKRKKKK